MAKPFHYAEYRKANHLVCCQANQLIRKAF